MTSSRCSNSSNALSGIAPTWRFRSRLTTQASRPAIARPPASCQGPILRARTHRRLANGHHLGSPPAVTELRFAKYQALGNDFLIVDARANPGLVDDAAPAQPMPDRHFGAGADDLIFLLPSDIADVRMRIRTPTGGWLRFCGNGIRCLDRFVRDEGMSSA